MTSRRRTTLVVLGLIALAAAGWWWSVRTPAAAPARIVLPICQDSIWGVISSSGEPVLAVEWARLILWDGDGLVGREWDGASMGMVEGETDNTSWLDHGVPDLRHLPGRPVRWLQTERNMTVWRWSRQAPFLKRESAIRQLVFDSTGELQLSCDEFYDADGRSLVYREGAAIYWQRDGQRQKLPRTQADASDAQLAANGDRLIVYGMNAEPPAVYAPDGTLIYTADWADPYLLEHRYYPESVDGSIRIRDTLTGAITATEAGDAAYHVVGDWFIVTRQDPRQAQVLLRADGQHRIVMAIDPDGYRVGRLYKLPEHYAPYELVPSNVWRSQDAALIATADSLVLLERGLDRPPVVIDDARIAELGLTRAVNSRRVLWQAAGSFESDAPALASPVAMLAIFGEQPDVLPVLSTDGVITQIPKSGNTIKILSPDCIWIQLPGTDDGEPATHILDRHRRPVKTPFEPQNAELIEVDRSPLLRVRTETGVGIWQSPGGWNLEPTYRSIEPHHSRTVVSIPWHYEVELADGRFGNVDLMGNALLEPQAPAERLARYQFFPGVLGGVYIAAPRDPDALMADGLVLANREHQILMRLPDGGNWQPVGASLLMHGMEMVQGSFARGNYHGPMILRLYDPVAGGALPGDYRDYRVISDDILWLLDTEGRAGWYDIPDRRWLHQPSK